MQRPHGLWRRHGRLRPHDPRRPHTTDCGDTVGFRDRLGNGDIMGCWRRSLSHAPDQAPDDKPHTHTRIGVCVCGLWAAAAELPFGVEDHLYTVATPQEARLWRGSGPGGSAPLRNMVPVAWMHLRHPSSRVWAARLDIGQRRPNSGQHLPSSDSGPSSPN